MLTLVRFDSETRVFRQVRQIPDLTFRGPRGRSDGYLERLLFGLLAKLMIFGRFESAYVRFIPRALVRFGRKIWQRYLGEWNLEEDEDWRSGPVAAMTESDTLLLMDVPQDLGHLAGLRKISEVSGGPTLAVYLHDLIPVRQAREFDPINWLSRVGSFQEYLRVVSRADVVVANSEFSAREFTAWMSERDMTLPPTLGVLYPAWPRPANSGKTSDDTQPEVGGVLASTADLRILALGAIDTRKNFRVLIPAIRKATEDWGLDCCLCVVAGSGKLIDKHFLRALKDLPRPLRRRVTFLPGVSDADVERLYDWADVVVVPSRAEGFGLPVVEALSRNVPVIVSRGTALTELADLFELQACDPFDSGEWSSALANVRFDSRPSEAIPEVIPSDYKDFYRRLEQFLTD